jgi:hypothetical protein
MFNFLSGGRARTSNRIRAQRARNATKKHLHLESLETRALLSGNVTATFASNGELDLKGDTNNNEIAITQLSTGQLEVTGSLGTTINHGKMFTTPAGDSVASIKLKFLDGNDSVSLTGFTAPGATGPTIEIPTVNLSLGKGNDFVTVDELWANSVTISATASLPRPTEPTADFDTVTVDTGSNINTLSITLGDASSDSVTLDDNINLGNVTVTEGSGSGDLIVVGTSSSPNLQLGTVHLTQGSGDTDMINVANDEVAHLLDITQGDGINDTVYVNDISGVPSTTVTSYAQVVITQGDGSGDYVYVANISAVSAQSLSITQGFGNFDEVIVGGFPGISYPVTLYGPPMVTFSPGPPTTSVTYDGGNLKIVQGDGESDSVGVQDLSAKNASITQGNGPSDTLYVEDSTLVGNLTINVGDGNGATVGVGDVSQVTVFGETYINVEGMENTLYLGANPNLVPPTSGSLETTSLYVDAGAYGSNTVYAYDVTVSNDQGKIIAGGKDNTYVDLGGNYGFETFGFGYG